MTTMQTAVTPYRLRPATAADVAVVARHRVAMFRDMGVLAERDCAALEAGSMRFLARAIPARDYRGWLADLDGAVVAGAGLVLRPLLPRPGNVAGASEAYVLNVYTEPAHRRHGLARALMAMILEWCRVQAIARVTLHASEDGRPLYESLRFTATNEMELML
jgi:GNAT superfamily N-acetyltransferase